MMLRLDIAWLSGTARLARAPSDHEPDWPPQPDRIYSALVASWGLGGENPEERTALEWLEGLKPPQLAVFADARPRQTVKVFVPVNDSKVRRDLEKTMHVLPHRRPRRERTFPSVALDADKTVHLTLCWDTNSSPEQRRALNALAHRTSYVGHSASLVRMLFTDTEASLDDLRPARSAPFPGRLRELEALHHRHLRGGIAARPSPSTRAGDTESAPASTRVFATTPDNWIVFEHAGGERPDLRATAIINDHMRLAVMESWTKANREPAPGWIAGHDTDGTPARDAHMAVVPLANVGWKHSDGALMGLALVPPQDEVKAWEQPGPQAYERHRAFRRAVAALGEKYGNESTILTLASQRTQGSWRWKLTPASSGAHSLDPSRYLGESQYWSTVTPVVLDRHLKAKGSSRNDEAKEVLLAACARAGLPTPSRVRTEKHASPKGVPSAWPPGGSPSWMGWSRKKSFGARQLFHVRLAFDDPVSGPILLGAGRFVGLGLFLPQRRTNI